MSHLAPPLDMTPSSSSSNPRRVAYYYDPDVGNYVYYLGHPMKPHRIRMAHNLIVNYGLCDTEDPPIEELSLNGGSNSFRNGDDREGSRHLNGGELDGDIPMDGGGSLDAISRRGRDNAELKYEKALLTGARGKAMQVFKAKRAGKGEMTRFHTDEYIDFLEKVTPETSEALTGGGVRCLIGEDCPPFEGLFEFCSISAGGSIAAAQRLNSGAADICVNWAGGLHHAKKTEASGFCYVNDIVLAILELLRIHNRVLYIDVDVHHGDGVEEAFYTTDRVMTASFHRFGEFFPGTGDVKDIGMKRGKGYAVNVPLRDGITDGAFHSVFKPVIKHIIEFFAPGAIVLQMGADSLSGDKLGGFNMTLDGHAECAAFVKAFNIPVLMLGGGGYTTKNVARAWCNETAVMCGRELPEDLPYNQYMEYYGPRYKLEVLANNTDNHNPQEYLESIKTRVLENLRHLNHAPSVQMQAVPKRSVGRELGLEDASDDDEVDLRLKKLLRKRKRLGHAGYSSGDSSSEDDEAPISRRKATNITKSSKSTTSTNRRRNNTGPELLEDDDDPCGVNTTRKKRSFFKSKQEGKSPLNMIRLDSIQGMGFTTYNGNGNGKNKSIGNGVGNGYVPATINGNGNGLGSLDGGNGNGIVTEWSANGNGVSRAASPMSVI